MTAVQDAISLTEWATHVAILVNYQTKSATAVRCTRVLDGHLPVNLLSNDNIILIYARTLSFLVATLYEVWLFTAISHGEGECCGPSVPRFWVIWPYEAMRTCLLLGSQLTMQGVQTSCLLLQNQEAHIE